MGLRVVLGIICIGLLVLVAYWEQPRDDIGYPGAGIFAHLVVILNIAIVCILGFLIGRNIVKLIFDRRRNILGAKLRTRLVVAFVGLILIPTTLLFWLASGLLNRALEGWFSTQVEASVDGAVDVGRLHYAQLKDQVGMIAQRLVVSLRGHQRLFNAEDQGNPESALELESVVETLRKERELFSVAVLGPSGIIVRARTPAGEIELFEEPEPDLAAVNRALRGESSVFLEQRDAGQFVRAYNPLELNHRKLALITTLRVDSDLSHALAQVTASFKEYQQLKLFKSPLKSGYLLTLTLITGLIIFAAVWFAFFLARQLVIPIQRLAEGTRAIARGNLDFQIRAGGDDEVGVLIAQFNTMTTDLKASRREAERRRAYLESILSNLAVGVIALDRHGRISAINAAAAELYSLRIVESAVPDLDVPGPLLGKSLNEVMAEEDRIELVPLIEELARGDGERTNQNIVLEREITISSHGRALKVLCTAGHIIDPASQASRGLVLLFDDITELSKAQHMSAWREVARRVAHEIKNPLTPIQLSAQRLQRLLANSSESAIVQECTQTIVEHVDSIKRLANEFSKFARMPTAEFKLVNLNSLISETLAPFAEDSSAIVFQFIADSSMPDVIMDAEQIRRVVINLVDNAVAAITGQSEADRSTFPGRVVVRSSYDRRRRVAVIEVADSGPGINATDRSRIFEPYFTTKERGTGLGLAIVTSILNDHQGEIRVYENQPRGTKFTVELPMVHRQVTQRRFASAGEGTA